MTKTQKENLLPEMTEDQLEMYNGSVERMKQSGDKEQVAKPHVYTRTDNQQKIVVMLTYSENFARQYSNGSGQSMVIMLADGVECFYDQQATIRKQNRLSGVAGVETAGNYPMASYAMGIDGDISDTVKFDEEHGVQTEYNEDHEPIFRSKKHRREYCRAHEVHDRNGGYSDP